MIMKNTLDVIDMMGDDAVKDDYMRLRDLLQEVIDRWEDVDTISFLRAFVLERRGWLQVKVMELGGNMWDVVLRIDGTYLGEVEGLHTRAGMVEHFERMLSVAIDADTADPNVD